LLLNYLNLLVPEIKLKTRLSFVNYAVPNIYFGQ